MANVTQSCPVFEIPRLQSFYMRISVDFDNDLPHMNKVACISFISSFILKHINGMLKYLYCSRCQWKYNTHKPWKFNNVQSIHDIFFPPNHFVFVYVSLTVTISIFCLPFPGCTSRSRSGASQRGRDCCWHIRPMKPLWRDTFLSTRNWVLKWPPCWPRSGT